MKKFYDVIPGVTGNPFVGQMPNQVGHDGEEEQADMTVRKGGRA